MSAKRVKRIPASFEVRVNGHIATTPRETLQALEKLDSHSLLDYARMLREIREFVADQSKLTSTALFGFYTGSLALALDTILNLPAGLAHFLPDLKHGPPSAGNEHAVNVLRNELERCFSKGTRRFVFLDELVSGSSMTGVANQSAKWAAAKDEPMTFEFAGARDAAHANADRALKRACTKARNCCASASFEYRVFTCRELLCMDKKGARFKPVRRRKNQQAYDWIRVDGAIPNALAVSGQRVDAPALWIECPGGGPRGTAPSSSDLASTFASVVKHILEGGYADTWPELILRDCSCQECVRLLLAARGSTPSH